MADQLRRTFCRRTRTPIFSVSNFPLKDYRLLSMQEFLNINRARCARGFVARGRITRSVSTAKTKLRVGAVSVSGGALRPTPYLSKKKIDRVTLSVISTAMEN